MPGIFLCRTVVVQTIKGKKIYLYPASLSQLEKQQQLSLAGLVLEKKTCSSIPLVLKSEKTNLIRRNMKTDYMSQADLVTQRIQNGFDGIGLKDTETTLKCTFQVHG